MCRQRIVADCSGTLWTHVKIRRRKAIYIIIYVIWFFEAATPTHPNTKFSSRPATCLCFDYFWYPLVPFRTCLYGCGAAASRIWLNSFVNIIFLRTLLGLRGPNDSESRLIGSYAFLIFLCKILTDGCSLWLVPWEGALLGMLRADTWLRTVTYLKTSDRRRQASLTSLAFLTSCWDMQSHAATDGSFATGAPDTPSFWCFDAVRMSFKGRRYFHDKLLTSEHFARQPAFKSFKSLLSSTGVFHVFVCCMLHHST